MLAAPLFAVTRGDILSHCLDDSIGHDRPKPVRSPVTLDVLIVGGGLAGSLAAWRLVRAHPSLGLGLVDAEATLGGNHTWSFHDSDLPAHVLAWIEPLVVSRWHGHEVRFPAYTRQLSGGYCSITSARLHEVIAPVLGSRVRLGTRAAQVSQSGATLESGETFYS